MSEKLSFECDYNTGAHPAVLKQLMETNLEPLPGYGDDKYCHSAAEKIKKACNCPNGEVFFLVGGTQTNEVMISGMLQEYQGVVAADTGHVSVHEAGAIEHSGHKVLTIPEHRGKIDAGELKNFLVNFYKDGNREHMVFPGMVYISQPTEYGSLYSLSELEEIHQICLQYDMPLYVDGARLGYALCSPENDVSLADLARLADAFYIGGTKVGALCGEAVIFTHGNAPIHFVNHIKKHGALLAKGRLLGVQFDALFTDDLYFEIGKQAISQAHKLVDILKKAGMEFFYESPTNQQFVILDNKKYEELSQFVSMGFWETYDENHTVVRLATTWSTGDEDLEALARLL